MLHKITKSRVFKVIDFFPENTQHSLNQSCINKKTYKQNQELNFILNNSTSPFLAFCHPLAHLSPPSEHPASLCSFLLGQILTTII